MADVNANRGCGARSPDQGEAAVRPSPLPTARTFPDAVPILIDAEAGVRLRATNTADLPAMVEQCRDPEMIRWTTVPSPPGGYRLHDAEEFLAVIADGWTSGERLGWAVEGQRGTTQGFCGSIDLRLEGHGIAEVGFGLHPEARGRSMMTAALHLVCDYGFDVVGLEVIRWRAVAGNWASRRVAANVGFVFDGTVRRLFGASRRAVGRLDRHTDPRRSTPAAIMAPSG